MDTSSTPTPTASSSHRATDPETLTLIETQSLHATGLGLVDARLLASALISGDVRLWTRDRRLAETAMRLGVSRSA